jgi:hypothetical protein
MTLTDLPASVLAHEAAPTTSARYVFIDSRAVIRGMKKEGWEVASAKTAQPRKRDPLFARHAVDFRRPGAKETEGHVPRILFINSHDGSSNASAFAGFFRFVCSNGLVIGTTTGVLKARHAFIDAAAFVHDAQALAARAEEQRPSIERWAALQLSARQRDVYETLAAKLRYGDSAAILKGELLTVRRPEDDSGSLLTVFNRVQENATRGGAHGVARSGNRTRTRPIGSIPRDVGFNAQLWQLTEELHEHWA